MIAIDHLAIGLAPSFGHDGTDGRVFFARAAHRDPSRAVTILHDIVIGVVNLGAGFAGRCIALRMRCADHHHKNKKNEPTLHAFRVNLTQNESEQIPSEMRMYAPGQWAFHPCFYGVLQGFRAH